MGLRFLFSVLLFTCCLPAFSQATFSVNQVVDFVRSSIRLKQPDKAVAAQLQHMKLKEKLDDQKIEDLQSEGAGPKTVAVLKEMGTASANLSTPPPPPAPVVRKVIPPPSYDSQQKVIDEVREYALNYSSTLPDFICKQTTRRFYDPQGNQAWRTADTIVSKLSYSGKKEDYKVLLVNGNVQTGNRTMESLGGTSSSGEFGSLLLYVFDPGSHTTFTWDRWGNIRGHITHVFSYTVEQQFSKVAIADGETKREVTPPYQGLVYVDRDTKQVLRLTQQSTDIPADFPIQLAERVLDYNNTVISGQKFLLPLKAQVRLDRGRYQSKNDVEFSSYQKFSADAVITFDTPEPIPDQPDETKPVKQKP